MADRTPKPGDAAEEGATPRWVKIFGIVALVLVLLFVALHLTGRGIGGPMQHSGAPEHRTQHL